MEKLLYTLKRDKEGDEEGVEGMGK